MVKKLFKHEILAYLRLVMPVQIILLAVAALGRFVQFFENDSTAYSIVSTSSIIAFVIAMLAALGLTIVFGIVRFYKNLFTCEGYLSFTLPATPTQHLLVKVTTAALFLVGTLLVMTLAVMIMTAGDVLAELIKAAAYLLNRTHAYLGWHLWAYMGELVVASLAGIFASFLLYYACISIGQTARKNRVMAAVGVYFAYYIITQVLETIMMVVFSQLYDSLPIKTILTFLYTHPRETGHIVLCGLIVLELILAALYFFVARWIMRRKLNLE